MTAVLRKQKWVNGRLHRWWVDDAEGKITHERLDPPEHIRRRALALERLRDSRRERARKADGLVLAASFTASERDLLHRMGVKAGDMEGLDWALKQDEFRHCKLTDGKLDKG